MSRGARLGSGASELIALLLLASATAPLGAILTMTIMGGAIASHLSLLGIEVNGDGVLLFGLALTVFGCAAIVLAIRRAQIPLVGHFFQPA